MHEFLKGKEILVVDDTLSIGMVISEYAKEFGISITYIQDSREAMESIRTCKYDLIILDIAMAYIDGLKLFELIRKEYDTPIIFLTAKGQEQDRITGLQLGADDYIVKPFSVIELFIRAETILKRITSTTLKVGAVTIDIESRNITYNDKIIKLTPKAYDLFLYLIRNKGKVCTREEIMENVIGSKYYLDDRVIDAHIKEIRQKIDTDIVMTKRGRGYIYD